MSHEHNDGSNGSAGLSRRTFLALTGLASAGALMVACGEQRRVVQDLPDPMGYEGRVPRFTEPPPPPAIPGGRVGGPVAPPATNTYGIIPRSAWARGGPDLRRVDPMGGVGLITFHHSGDPKPFTTSDYAETATHLEYVREYHRSRNFQDIGYHFAIDRAGRVWQLRSLKYEGQHVRYNNEHNVGVVVLGNFDMQAPTQAQKDKIRQFALILRKQYNLPISRIKTHQEIVSTECPGRGMQPYMVAIRKQGLC